MLSATAYGIRPAREADAPALRRLAFLDDQEPLTGSVLLGEVDGLPAAAISVDERRIVADPAYDAGLLRIHLRVRAAAQTAYQRTPALEDRIRAALRGEPLSRPTIRI